MPPVHAPDSSLGFLSPGQGMKAIDAIAGIHTRVVECRDGSLYSLGRLGTIDGRMPASRSTDGGTT